jgi:lipase chaperone LimK
MIEKDDLLRLRIEALRVLARTNEPNRAVLIERNIEDYLKTAGSEKPSLERVRDAIEREEAEKRQGEDWSIAKDYVRSRLSWLA